MKRVPIIFSIAILTLQIFFGFGYIRFPDNYNIRFDTNTKIKTHLNYQINYELLPSRDTIPDIDTSSQRILIIGDSMAYFFWKGFGDYCAWNGHSCKLVSWVSSTTEWFARYDTISYFIKEYCPTYIIFTIGSNELSANNITELADYIETIKVKFGKIKTLWIGPPNWKEDTGINDLMMNHLNKKKFFLSKNLQIERKEGDVAHPSLSGCKYWADTVAIWIVEKSIYPIVLEKPDSSYDLDFEKIVLEPLY